MLSMLIVRYLFRFGFDWRLPLAFAATLAAGWSFAPSAAAEEVRVFTVRVFAPAVAAVAPAFEKRTKHKVVVVSDTDGALVKRIRDGEVFDLAVLPPVLLETLGSQGMISDGSIIPLARAVAGTPNAGVYAGALSSEASDSRAALSLLILLASEDTQMVLKSYGMAPP
jgi:ABC-type molybdate transport system substrate-binding protein